MLFRSSLYVGDSEQLTATVLPDNATDKTVTWSSDNTGVATVDEAGNVKALAAGTAKITVTTILGRLTATCEVSVIEMPKINGHEYVDLGLPSGLKWASMNVGATKPEEYGDYFAWGETEPYYEAGYAQSDNPIWKNGKELGYDWPSYRWCNGAYNKLTKYCTDSSCWDSAWPMDNKTTLDLDDDAAHINCGGSWRMPTDAEWTELLENCTWTWTTQNGVNGRRVTSKTNSDSIFLPAAGCRHDTRLYDVGSFGSYWSSSLYTGGPTITCGVGFYSDAVYWFSSDRYVGFSVRPVCPKE